MVNDMYAEIRCPCRKRHNKRKHGMLVVDETCNALLPFIKPVDGSDIVIRCKDCKNLLTITCKNDLIYIKQEDKNMKVKTEVGRVVVECSEDLFQK